MFDSAKLMYSSGPGPFYDYPIDGSLRFNDNDSAYLSRTPASAGNRKTWTWSGWVKRGNLGSLQGIFGADDVANEDMLGFLANDTLRFYQNGQATGLVTNAVFRDPSAWYHIVIAMDTTQATASDRTKIYVNGTSQTFTGSEYIAQNHDTQINSTQQHVLGYYLNAGYTFDGYLTEVHFIDGQSDSASITSGSAVVTGLTDTSTLQVGWSVGGTGIASGAVISSIDSSTQITMSENATATNASATLAFTPLADAFGEEISGVWKPIEYTGSYGTNGFYLPLTTDANDASGEDNHWIANNLDAYDYVLDSPTNNFATFNILDQQPGYPAVFYEGNTKFNPPYNQGYTGGRVGTVYNTGKIYYEVEISALANQYNAFGFAPDSYHPSEFTGNLIFPGKSGSYTAYGVSFETNDNTVYYDGSSTSALSDSLSVGDIVMLAFDTDTGNFWYGKNGTWAGSGDPATASNPAATLTQELDKKWTLAVTAYSQGTMPIINAGQDSSFAGNKTAQGNTDDNGYGDFYYAPPTGYLALCTANLEVPDAMNPALDASPQDYFNTLLWTGDGASTRSLTGVGFQPDFVWTKARNYAYDHPVYDSIRGATKVLWTSSTAQEYDSYSAGYLTSFDADGFSVSAGSSNDNYVNDPAVNYVAWNWKANGSGVSNTDGSITSTVSANTDAGFSIVSYSGDHATGATVGHGLSQAPEFVITKSRDDATNWGVYYNILTGSSSTNWIILNSTAAQGTGNFLNVNTTTLGMVSGAFGNQTNMIAYCFHSVEGFSKFGSYTGNGSTDGTFVYTGFRPAFVITKKADGLSGWALHDSERSPYNVTEATLYPNASDAETNPSTEDVDFLSNGFKIRATTLARNSSGGTYIYMAFASMPTKFSTAV